MGFFMKIRPFRIVIAAIGIAVAYSPAGHAQEKQQEFERVETLPMGSNTSVLGTMFALNTTNVEEYVFDAPIDRVWMAVKVAARDFEKNAGRAIAGVDEQRNRVFNGRINQMGMATSGGFSPFVDEFVTEARRESDTQTKVTVVRKVMRREGRSGWSPQKSNGMIERYLLTQIADNLKKPLGESPQSATANKPPALANDPARLVGKPSGQASAAQRLKELNALYKDGLISEKEFEAKRQEILGSI